MSDVNEAKQLHDGCFVCSSSSDNGLAVEFIFDGVDSVSAEFLVNDKHQGYAGLLHGGIASTLLDGAMTHCLLNMGIPALTAELSVRYHSPVPVESKLKIQARLIQQKRGIYLLCGELYLADTIAVSANGKFLRSKTYA